MVLPGRVAGGSQERAENLRVDHSNEIFQDGMQSQAYTQDRAKASMADAFEHGCIEEEIC